MTLLDILKLNNPLFERIDVSPIFDELKSVVGWHSIAYSPNSLALAGGTHQDQSVATRICVAEALERVLAGNLYKDVVLKEQFLLTEFPSTCGFACGFENDKTKLRAIAEGLERWIWSNWIDHRCNMSRIEKPLFGDPLLSVLCSKFGEAQFFHKKFQLDRSEFVCGIFVGLTDEGAFAGSRVCSPVEDPWQHAMIEAVRNLQNYKLAVTNGVGVDSSEIVRMRAIYFGSHKKEALAQIANATRLDWQEPKFRLLKEYDTKIPGVYLWRCILHDWIGWHLGDEKRFVY